jgi:squalene synthase HpnC
MSPSETSASTAQPGIPAGIPGFAAVHAQHADENFPVALRLLSRDVRRDLLAVYGFARLADDIGDEHQGDRLAALDWLEADLNACVEGRARHPVVARLGPTIARRGIELGPFRDLIDANRRDQVQHRYATFDDLLDYCRLSANPVGRIVLAIFGVSNPATLPLSDDVCSALQIIEHLQDVGEDLHAGRVYLPLEDLVGFGCTEADLAQPAANPAVRRLVAHVSARARSLLDSGRPLTAMLGGQSCLAIAGFVAGGRATLDAIESADFDVLAHRCRPSRHRVVMHMAGLLAHRPARRLSR